MTNSKILRDEFHRINGTDPDNGLDIPKYLLWLEDRAVLPQADFIKSVCDHRNEAKFCDSEGVNRYVKCGEKVEQTIL